MGRCRVTHVGDGWRAIPYLGQPQFGRGGAPIPVSPSNHQAASGLNGEGQDGQVAPQGRSNRATCRARWAVRGKEVPGLVSGSCGGGVCGEADMAQVPLQGRGNRVVSHRRLGGRNVCANGNHDAAPGARPGMGPAERAREGNAAEVRHIVGEVGAQVSAQLAVLRTVNMCLIDEWRHEKSFQTG